VTTHGKKKLIDNNLRNLIVSKQITKPSSSFLNEKGDLVQKKYNNMPITIEREIIENSPVGDFVKREYEKHIKDSDIYMTDNMEEEYRRKSTKNTKIKRRCRCKK
jgi:hypothetical protein